MKQIHIAIDGPAGAGKSTVAKILAKRLHINYLDTGAMYRAITYHILNQHIDVHNNQCIIDETNKVTLDFLHNDILLNGIKVNNEIRTTLVNNNVSIISAIPQIREILVRKQQEIAKGKSVVMDGRDISTVVLPFADYKFYIDASIEIRAQRRFGELSKKGIIIDFEQIKNDILHRDYMDQNRSIAPLQISNDAIIIDSSNKTINEIVTKIIKIVQDTEG